MATYNVAGGDWDPLGNATMYRWIPPRAEYEPNAPWPGNGRFDSDSTPTLYLSSSAEGALAEYYRRHPEFLEFQDRLKVRLFEIEFTGGGEGLDVSTEDRTEEIGFPWERLRSSDARRVDRYRECQLLARDVLDELGGPESGTRLPLMRIKRTSLPSARKAEDGLRRRGRSFQSCRT
jgi:hypothetical protein